MRLRLGAALVVAVLTVAGCDTNGGTTANTTTSAPPQVGQSATVASSAPPQVKSVTVIVSVSTTECKPPGVPGNCWLPLYPQPTLQGTAFNQSAACNNDSRDQSSCWPQPGTTLEAVCTAQGNDGRQVYGVLFHVTHIVATLRPTFTPRGGGTQAIGYAASSYMVPAPGAQSPQLLPSCSNFQ